MVDVMTIKVCEIQIRALVNHKTDGDVDSLVPVVRYSRGLASEGVHTSTEEQAVKLPVQC